MKTAIINPMDFQTWITKKYVKWRGEAVGRNRSVSDFADFIGVKQQAMSSWMNGSIPKRHETITKLVAKFGPEVYDVLGIPNPYQDDRIYEFLDRISKMTAEQRARYLDLGNNILSEE
jgi:hypothetical protein